jgi:pimeloyl-ACP methyl ester carboxylesterase
MEGTKFEGEVSILGHSMGGYIILAFAEKFPQYLNAFGLFHSTAYADSEEKKNTRKKGIEFIKQYGAFEFLKTVVPNLFSPDSKEKMPGKISDFINSLHNFSPTALVSYYEAMMQRPDRTDVLKKSKIPVLFIMGKYDTAIPLEDGLEQCHLPEKSYIHILHKSGHMGMMEEAEESNRFLEEFLMET